MSKESELWDFIADRLPRGENVMLLVVAESSGSSPGRAGYKMAVGADGELCGSIGGGVMEVKLVELAKAKSKEAKGKTEIQEQVHRKDVVNSSGMICSGRQTVIFKLLMPNDAEQVQSVVDALQRSTGGWLTITPKSFGVAFPEHPNHSDFVFQKLTDKDFIYRECIGHKNELFIIGGGHCALALSELMSRMDFRIHIFDDRPDLNTLEKNEFADKITIFEDYAEIADHIPSSHSAYVVVMTLGYKTDGVVMRKLIDKDFNYFGVLGSRAKMATMMRNLRAEGLDPERLARIRMPIGLPINSRTPEEIAVSIAAEIISVKNAKA